MPQDTLFEFRDYTLHPGKRETLIALFEHEFIEPQERLSVHVRATFRDLDKPDRFVWIRSFADADARRDSLNAFYTGPVWAAHRDAANATMIDSDNVLQLRPVSGGLGASPHPALEATELAKMMILATTYFLAASADGEFAAFHQDDISPMLRDMGAAPFATFATEHAPNSFPRLPVREGETVFLTLTRFVSSEAHASSLRESAKAWREIAALLKPRVVAPTENRRLQPTARSALR